jgi:hypothetical protein
MDARSVKEDGKSGLADDTLGGGAESSAKKRN